MFNKSKIIFSLLLILLMTFVLASCGGGGGGGGGGNSTPAPNPNPNPAPTNHSPLISCPANSSLNEGDVYNGDVNHTDSDARDTATYSLIAGNPPLNINSSTGIISGSTAGYGGQTIPVTARVVDSGGLSDTCSFNVNVIRPIVTHNVSGVVKSLVPGAPCISGADVELTASDGVTKYDAFTSVPTCAFQFNALPEDTYSAKITDTGAVNVSYKPGDVIVNQAKADAGKLSNLEAGLYPRADFVFVNYVLRSNGEIKKHIVKPVFDFYLFTAANSHYPSLPVPSEKKNMIENVIKNKMSNTFGQYIFTDADINEINSAPVFGQPPDGHIKVYVDTEIAGGRNFSWRSGAQVLSSFFSVSYIPLSEGVVMQEAGETLTGSGGETNDNNYYDSIFHDPGAFDNPGILSLEDRMLVNIFNSRKAGNQYIDGVDTEPAGTVWNE